MIGIGNILMGDDGIGVHVVNELLRAGLPNWIEVVDGGTHVFSLLPLISDAEILVIIDAIDAGLCPGEMIKVWLDAPKIAEQAKMKRLGQLSLHEVDIWQTLSAAKLLGKCPKNVLLIGIQVGSIEQSCEISPNLSERMDEYVASVRDACLKLSAQTGWINGGVDDAHC